IICCFSLVKVVLHERKTIIQDKKVFKQSTFNTFLGFANIIMILLVACTVIINTSFRKVILAEERITEFKQSGPGLVNASTY
ncbi:MAG TPA: hypothetical protein VFD02_04220, partial [Syntrophomonadaceae bacterium]|nr:hypothetical protein [Syntrophomonadaceae bacterium]